ncbi:MAG: CvfD/Ygs/GSP13 family RNA-binding post-transcriptional regulator [Erysipelotrichaceae bacterium]
MKYQIGSIVEGMVTGIQAYGAFVKVDEDTMGLVHISEISDGFVKDVSNFVSLNQIVQLKVIDYDDQHQHLRLSLKALNAPSLRKNNRKRKFKKLPDNQIGFNSIEEKMKEWIKEALND